MPKLRFLILLCLFFAVISVSISVTSIINKPKPKIKINKIARVPKDDASAAFLGEKIIYNIKYGKLSLGTSEFNFLSKVDLNGNPAYLMTLNTRLAKFNDAEKIFSDPLTFLPIRIERNILNWFSKESITEDYDQKNFSVTITKTKGSKKSTLVIKKSSPIQNAILLPHYARRLPELKIGTTIPVNLPNKELNIKLVSIEDVIVPAGKFKAYHFESLPKQIEIWITADEHKLPVKIIGAGIFGYSMEMEKYIAPVSAAANLNPRRPQ